MIDLITHPIITITAVVIFVVYIMLKIQHAIIKRIITKFVNIDTQMVQNSINLGAFIMMDSFVETHLKNGDAFINKNNQVQIGEYIFIKQKLNLQEYWTNVEIFQDFQKNSIERIEEINFEYEKTFQKNAK